WVAIQVPDFADQLLEMPETALNREFPMGINFKGVKTKERELILDHQCPNMIALSQHLMTGLA
ncbi:hypothetical protein ACFL0C_00635, partial [Patescibacteria group bacterium]